MYVDDHDCTGTVITLWMTQNVHAPINYDFGKFWQSQVVQHLQSPELKQVLEQVYQEMKTETPWPWRFPSQTYDWTQPPAYHFSKNSTWAELLEYSIIPQHISDDNFTKLIENCCDLKEKDDYLRLLDLRRMAEERLEQNLEYDEKQEYYDDYDIVEKPIRDAILKIIGYDFKFNQDKLAFYVPYGSCHWWNSVFGLWLAKRVFPTYKWEILTSDEHTTVYCAEYNMIFDIIYWANERLSNYVLGEPLSESALKDATLGGEMAFKAAKGFVRS